MPSLLAKVKVRSLMQISDVGYAGTKPVAGLPPSLTMSPFASGLFWSKRHRWLARKAVLNHGRTIGTWVMEKFIPKPEVSNRTLDCDEPLALLADPPPPKMPRK